MKRHLSKQFFTLTMALMLFSLLPNWVEAQSTWIEARPTLADVQTLLVDAQPELADAQQLISRRCQAPFTFCPPGYCCRLGYCRRCLPFGSDPRELIKNDDSYSSFIKYWLESEGAVSISLYDASGQLIRTLVDEWMSSGDHQLRWNEKDDIGNTLNSGVYLLTLQTGDLRETTRVIAVN